MKNKKYRLIKKYPGSPELGTIIIKTAYQKLRENGTVPPYRNPEFYVLINSLEKHCL